MCKMQMMEMQCSCDSDMDRFSAGSDDLVVDHPKVEAKLKQPSKVASSNNDSDTSGNTELNKKSRVCQTQINNIVQFNSHRKTCVYVRPKPRINRCEVCHKPYDTNEEYNIHCATDTDCIALRKDIEINGDTRSKRRRFQCRVCPKKLYGESLLIEHEFKTHGMLFDSEKWPDLNCQWCEYKTIVMKRLRFHEKHECSRGQELVCDDCGNTYKTHIGLQQHKKTVHSDSVPWLKCDQCEKLLKGENGLKKHINLVHKRVKSRQHMCHLCSTSYRYKRDLPWHLYKAHGLPLPESFNIYSCGECGYETNTKSALSTHVVRHKETRDWKCDVCSKGFKSKLTLNVHMKSHAGKKYRCSHNGCKYSTSNSTQLKDHIANQHTHKGYKDKWCHLCDFQTCFKGNLKKHLKNKHKLIMISHYTVNQKAKYRNLKNGQLVSVDDGAIDGD